MKILILGASGFIGNAAFDYFSKQNETTGVDKVNLGRKEIFLDSDFSLTKRLIIESKYDFIINCAGSSDVKDSFINTEKDFIVNVNFVQNVLSVLKSNSPQTKFINLSSAAVYGNPSTLPINENEIINPISPYGFHKFLSEQLISEYSKLFNLGTLSVRIFSAYGNGLKRQLLFDLYSKFNTNPESICLFGTGSESRDFIFITDIINAIEILISNASFKGEVYNLASGEESFINKTALLFASICNYNGEIIFQNSQIQGYPINWKADITKLKSLGFSPQVSLKDGLEEYFSWIDNNNHS
ncbi:MAG: NAD-dependent epimerase/dehydratase family protein [Bacteroidetes bacterium]|nr:NAD-dependent epimerase/dehydratase family protein [Bacteroidota bacterium]